MASKQRANGGQGRYTGAMDLDDVAEVIEAVFTAAVQDCEFQQVVEAKGEVNVPETSRKAAERLAELGMLA